MLARVDENNVILEIRNVQWSDIAPNKQYLWRDYIVIDPVFDDATQLREGPVTTVFPDRVEVVYTIRAKTALELQAELDQKQTTDIDRIGTCTFKALHLIENRHRVLTGQNQVAEGPFRTGLKNFFANNTYTPDTSLIGVLRDTAAPQKLFRFDANITIGVITGAALTDKTFTIPGLLTSDLIVCVQFTAGLTPATISYTPLRVSAADTLAIRFAKIVTGNVTPPAPQAISVLVIR